jgi:hypothetical protein
MAFRNRAWSLAKSCPTGLRRASIWAGLQLGAGLPTGPAHSFALVAAEIGENDVGMLEAREARQLILQPSFAQFIT